MLFISTNCHFCQQSLPLYARLAKTVKAHPEIVFRVLSVDPPEKVREFLDWPETDANRVYRVSFPDPVFKAAPTLAIIDAHGVIRRAFVGTLDETREKRLLEALEARDTELAGGEPRRR